MTPERGDGRTRVLVADGQDVVRRFLIRTLSGKGYDARGAALGRDALIALAQEPDGFSLLVTDLDLPDIGGEDLARRVRSVSPRLKVLFMTGEARRDVSHLSSQGPVIVKPFTHGFFLAAVADLLPAP